jgi:hypothetical protein
MNSVLLLLRAYCKLPLFVLSYLLRFLRVCSVTRVMTIELTSVRWLFLLKNNNIVTNILRLSVMSCYGPVSGYQRFGGINCLHFRAEWMTSRRGSLIDVLWRQFSVHAKSFFLFLIYVLLFYNLLKILWISEADTIHRWSSGAYVMRSSGHILLSLLPISGCLISWLLFYAVGFLCFFAYVLITSVTYGMRKSLCKVTFDMYQGALVSFLNVLD